jgi:DNA end-binding protein Ku
MARALWTGSLSFGLVTVPVALTSAVRDRDLHFRQLHAADASPIDVQRWCPAEDVEVPFDEVTRSYDLEDGGVVMVSDEDLEAVEPRRTRTIDIEQFVDLDDVDPIYFDHPYFLLVGSDDDGALRAYRLLAEVMAGTGRAALGRFVMRAKEYLVIIRADPRADHVLTLTTMRFADEVRDASAVEAPRAKKDKPPAKQMKAAVSVIEGLSRPWEPERHVDCYRERLQRVIEAKGQGETVTAPSSDGARPAAPDLMEALERTLAELK